MAKTKRKVRMPAHVKDAVKTLSEHLKCDVEAEKTESKEWVLYANTLYKLPTRWKSMQVRRK